MKLILIKLIKKINLVVFDDLVFSDKKISTFFTQSRKINVTFDFIAHSFLKLINY